MFHGEAPGGGLLVAVASFHGSDGLAIAQVEQLENGFAFPGREFEALGAVMEALAWGSARDAAAGPVIELVEAGLELD